ncbi:MAG: 4Fe-4S binding protein [Spirochaetes bacterium]|nr:4Fe-4S binding protein [Spirochaetota bacterium]MBU1079539.1 4Fe-4S binding protein [Spirochaetota bacterium]
MARSNAAIIPPGELEAVATAYAEASASIARRVVVCGGTGCIANGSLKVYEALVAALAAAGQEVVVDLDIHDCSGAAAHVSTSGCQGFCQVGPLVTIEPDGILYTHVKGADVEEIVSRTFVRGGLVERLLYRDPVSGERKRGKRDIGFYAKQERRVMAECGSIDPEDLNEYIARGGYRAARKALFDLSPAQICAVVKDSGLRGRGGAGFPTGRKWELALRQASPEKYIICNGDEGDPGAFMDRSVLEGNPHSVIEGMLIGARATGAGVGYVYVRAEYPLAVQRVRKAVADAEAAGFLGADSMGSGTAFELRVMEGAGAFVCGEASAMVSSIMGNRGMPRPKPPRTAEQGLWGKPTVVNNVETLAQVALIIDKGAAEYRSLGTAGSSGTKTYALTGHVANTGLIEVPFGATLRRVVFDIGGGILDRDGRPDDAAFKAVQIGGPSGGCLTAEHLDVPMDFDSLGDIGAMVGSGGLVVMNDSTCMVQMARFFMQFTQRESCGKCVPCREGTQQILALLDDVIAGNGTLESLGLLEALCENVADSSLCGLGASAPAPVLSMLRQFRSEYEAHVVDKRCPTGQCSALVPLSIDAAACKGCTACARKCPVGAISGAPKQAHAIDAQKCIKCGACVAACKFDAIKKGAA